MVNKHILIIDDGEILSFTYYNQKKGDVFMEKEFVVITDMGGFDENVYYCGLSEIEAYKKYRSIKGKFRMVNIIKANVERKLFHDVPFIWSYNNVEIIK